MSSVLITYTSVARLDLISKQQTPNAKVIFDALINCEYRKFCRR